MWYAAYRVVNLSTGCYLRTGRRQGGRGRRSRSGEERAVATMRPVSFFGGDPFRELRRLQDEMDRLAGAFAPAGGLAAAGFPAVNVYAGRDGVAVGAELPGVGPGDLEVHARPDRRALAR